MNYMLMNAPMALATQQGIKTQTRRPIKFKNGIARSDIICQFADNKAVDTSKRNCVQREIFDRHVGLTTLIGEIVCPKYKVGQKLWIREPAKVTCNYMNGMHQYIDYMYLSDGKIKTIHVPKVHKDKKWVQNHLGIPNGCTKEMARTFIIITDIRVERLNNIEYEDILAEGFPMDYEPKSLGTKTYFADTHGEIDYEEDRANEWFTSLIESISGKGSFDDKWVFVYEYKTITKEEAGI